MRKLMLLLAVLGCVVGLCGIAQATEYHVGSGQQYATMNALLSAVTPGNNDIIWVHPGTYGPWSTYSGGGDSQAQAVQVRAWDVNNKPVFDAAGTDNCIIISPGFTKWWKLSGLEIKNAAFRGIYHVGGGIVIENCYLHHCGNGIMSGMYNTQESEPGYMVAEYNELGFCGAENRRHSFYVQEYWIKARYNWIYEPVAGLCYKDRSRDSLVEYNLIEQGPNGPYAVEFCGYDDPTMPDIGQTATMTGNIVTKNGGTNSWLFLGNERGEGGVPGGQNLGYLYLYNNNFYTENHTGPMIGADDGSIITAHNNIFHSTTCNRIMDKVDYADSWGVMNTSYNNWVKTGIATPSGFTSTVTGTAPGWVSGTPSGGDFHLTSSSPCRDAGRDAVPIVATKEYAHPHGYTIRPADSTMDIGAYEYAVGGSLPPVARFEGDPTSGNMPLTVSFTDLSANTPTSWSWSFGDGSTSTAQHPSHTYSNPGAYTVSLTVWNSLGSNTRTQTGYIVVIDPNAPVAGFDVDTRFGASPLTVEFTDTSTNNPTSWSWAFGDGGTSTSQNPTHTYSTVAMYTVTLTVANSYGSDSETKTDHIAVCQEVVLYPTSWGNGMYGDEDVTVVSGGLSDLVSDNNVYMEVQCDTADQKYIMIYETLCGYTATQIFGMRYDYQAHVSRTDTPSNTLMHIRGANQEYQLLNPDGEQWTTSDEWWYWETTNPAQWVEGDGTIGFGMCACPANTNSYTISSDVMRFRLYLKPGQSPQPPVAAFSGTPTSGAAPLAVSFTDSSTNTPTSWSWNFGDSTTSTSQNPSHTYSSVGSYTVSLRATNASGYDDEVKTNYITVTVVPPVANFTGTPTSGTAPLTVAFTDSSTNAPTSWSWNFGDSSTSTAQSPSHVYNSAGSFTVSLRATNAGGYDDEIKTNYITATVPAPVAAFSGSPTSGTAPLSVSFTDSSTNTPTSWSWNFGDSTTSTSQNPSHSFAAGTFTVSLRATNAGGYDDEVKTNYITATSGGATTPTFVAAGAVASSTGAITPALPAGIATNDILLLFLETANQAISISNQNGGTWAAVTNSPQGYGTAAAADATRITVYWSRYNGTQGAPTTSDSGNHQLGRIIAVRGCPTSGDPWNVTAGSTESTVDTSGAIPSATTTVSNTLVVAGIATSLPDASSTANFSAWANANLTSITERTDNTVTANNGGGLAIATGEKLAAGAYGDTSVTCAVATTKALLSLALRPAGTVAAPVAAFSGTPTSGTAPLSVTFTDASTNTPTSWSWNFGDSTTSTSQNPSHSFAAGTYTVSLRATNAGGYDDEVKTNYITATVPAPVAAFSGTPTSGTAPLSVTFTDASTNTPTSWSWNFGDSTTSTSQNPSHSYAAGTFTVSLRATNAGGYDDEVKTNYITATSGGGMVTIYSDSFNNGLTGWTTETTARSCYCSAQGNYLINIREGGAMYRTISTVGYSSISVTYEMQVVSLEAGEKIDVLWYNGSVWTVIDTITSGDADADGQWRTYTFGLPSGANNNLSFALKFDQTANAYDDNIYLDDLVVEGTSGTLPPVANFTGAPTSGTAPLAVAFTDTSTNTPTAWSWNFGDGSTSTSQNPSHTYAAGTYTVSLTATNAGGSDGETKTGYITASVPPPVANFTGNPTSGTAPLAVAFTDSSTNTPTSWSWNFGDSTTSTSQNPSHSYAAGTYTVFLRATNAGGYDDEVKTNYVTATVLAPVANFSGTPTSGTAPLAVSFTDSSTNTPTSWSWNFGDSTTSTSQNPSHSYVAGTYTVSLRATNAGGYDDEVKTNYITATSGGQVTIYSDNFDGGLTGWSTQPEARSCYCASPANNLIDLRANGAMWRTISTAGRSSIVVTVDLRVTGLESGEYFQVQWYDGSSWTVADTIAYGDPDADGQWRTYTYNLPSGANNNANFALKFWISCDTWEDNGYIDNLVVKGS